MEIKMILKNKNIVIDTYKIMKCLYLELAQEERLEKLDQVVKLEIVEIAEAIDNKINNQVVELMTDKIIVEITEIHIDRVDKLVINKLKMQGEVVLIMVTLNLMMIQIKHK